MSSSSSLACAWTASQVPLVSYHWAFEVFDVHALLLDPGVVLQVVDALALGVGQLQHAVGLEIQHVQVVIQLGLACAE